MRFDGDVLRAWRTRRALSLRELAEVADVSYIAIYQAEVRKRTPRPKTVRKLAAALGVDPAVFYPDLDEQEKKAAA
jgi:transcriptional regulator with XRE-family HTH domain